MYPTGEFIQEMLLIYGLALLGFVSRRTLILNEHANEVLTQLILYIRLPALILYSLDISFSLTRVIGFWNAIFSNHFSLCTKIWSRLHFCFNGSFSHNIIMYDYHTSSLFDT
ncbi:hypothetical protein [Neobacillus sp. CF12]|uniref:hypothetical protein n=1 Tax=Neobacillus sp. CF12 TaxID=3055864 RepID=UPI0025A237F5|nr:hypothetical protein [Neobacillus sp. CF12]MDM5331569.1 hypothetical protein [Neobacillus sp. CF12]